MKPISVVRFAMALCLFACAAAAGDLDWPMFRRDTCLTGRSPAKGSIEKPVILDKLFAGAYEGLLVSRPDPKGVSLSLDHSRTIAPDYWTEHTQQWSTDGALCKFDGDANSSHKSINVRLIPELDCPQKLQFECAFDGAETQTGFLYAYDQPDGKPRVVWKTEPEVHMYAPIILIVDADGDGQREVVVATHYRVMIFDARTGAKKTELRWHGLRNYGFFGCFTVPGEKLPKFVVLSDFAQHIDVLDNDGKELKVLWRRDIQPSIMSTQKIVRVGPNPIADVDGDGRFEITFSMFDDTGDRRWHVVAYDALSGSLRFDIPGALLHGIADMDADGLPELFVQNVPGPRTPRLGRISLVSFKGGKQADLWEHERAAWQTTSLSRLPLTANTSGERGSVLIADTDGGRECYAVASREGGRESLLTVGCGESGKWAVRSVVTGTAGARMALKAVRESEHELLITWRSGGGKQKVDTKNAVADVVSWRAIPGPTPAPIVARLRPKDPPSLIVQNGSEEVVAYKKAAGGWKQLWKRQGRGMTWDGITGYGVLAADVNGDGELETLLESPSPLEEADLVAAGPDGKTRWSHTFQSINGGMPIWNLGCLPYWTVGHFTSREHLDVLVTPRLNMMHSFEGHCLSGKDGHRIWRQSDVKIATEDPVHQRRGYGGSLFATADVDGCGLDEIICAYPDRFWVAPGKTGQPRTVVSTQHGVFPNLAVFYATPVVEDLLGEGCPQAIWGSSTYISALFRMNGEPVWYGEYKDGPSVLQGVAKTNESGRLLIGAAGHKDGFRCCDPANGKVLWTFPVPDPAEPRGHPISADVNGDGVEEFVFSYGKTVYALNGKGGKPNLIWSIELPAIPGPLAFADVDGNGDPEIIAGAADGYVYIVGGG